MKNHYQILGIPAFSSMADIRREYRTLALKHHPDRGGDAEVMKDINNSYDFLMKNKESYDATLRPKRPMVVRMGFTIVVNEFGYGFSRTSATSTATGGF